MFQAIGEMLALGIATSIHPCPLAAGVAALAFLARRAGSPRQVFLAALLYAVGGAIAYGALAAIVLAGVRASPLAWLLHRWVHQALGPILILLGMLFLGWIRLPRPSVGCGGQFPARVERLGLWAALPMGLFVALSFCPASAAVFFGAVLRMAAQRERPLLLPLVYGVGAVLPVLFCAGLLALGAQAVGKAFGLFARIDWWGRRIAGAALILVGVYFCVRVLWAALGAP